MKRLQYRFSTGFPFGKQVTTVCTPIFRKSAILGVRVKVTGSLTRVVNRKSGNEMIYPCHPVICSCAWEFLSMEARSDASRSAFRQACGFTCTDSANLLFDWPAACAIALAFASRLMPRHPNCTACFAALCNMLLEPLQQLPPFFEKPISQW